MHGTIPAIKCNKCGSTFEPDLNAKEDRPCPSCQASNPNLRRHYRSVADLCILGFIGTAVFVAVGIATAGVTLGVVLAAAEGVLLLVTIVFVYRSKAPWIDRRAKNLIWTVFGLALLFNVFVPLVRAGSINIPFLVVYGIVFPYLLWLNAQLLRLL
jgi:uncharacterized membrane-anchored protein